MKESGTCDHLNLERLFEKKNEIAEIKGKKSLLTLINFTDEVYIYCCILAGCDYLKPIKGGNIKKIIGYFERYKSLEKVVSFLR